MGRICGCGCQLFTKNKSHRADPKKEKRSRCLIWKSFQVFSSAQVYKKYNMADLLLCPLSYLYKFNHDHHGSSPYTGFSHIKRERKIYDGNIDNFPGCILFLHDLGGVLHCTAAPPKCCSLLYYSREPVTLHVISSRDSCWWFTCRSIF